VRWGIGGEEPSLGGIEWYFKRRKQEGGNGGLFSCGADGLHGWLLVAAGSDVVLTWIDAWRGRVHPVEWIWW
jgi:hypothetical protein